MRKTFAVLLAVFAVTFIAGAMAMPDASAGPCFYRCICSVPHKCCTTNGVTTCKPVKDSPIQCTQVYDC
jgi:hypothetical protein